MSLRNDIKSGELYYPNEDGLLNEQEEFLELLYDFNNSRPSEREKRNNIIKKLFADYGEGSYIEPPMKANWGANIHFGKGVYANFGLTLVDDADIFVGDDVMFGPNVTVATAGHPIWPKLRKKGAQFNLPVFIGNNVWIGAGAVILPGVKIGDNSVIGAGSIVTKDIPSDVVAVGNPCKVLREISEKDRIYYYKNKEIGDFK